jgi:magnesium transporter
MSAETVSAELGSAELMSVSAHGERKQVTEKQRANPVAAIAGARRSGGFVWIGLIDPDEDEMREVGERFGLHPLAVRDAATGKQQPKVQAYDEHLFVVMWAVAPERSRGDVAISEVFIFARDGLLLTVQRNGGRQRPDLGKVLETADSLAGGAMTGLYAMMASVAIGYTDLTSVIEEELEALEEQVFDESAEDDAQRIYTLRKQVGKVDRAVSSLATALRESKDHFNALTVGNTAVEPYFRDLLDDLAGTDQLITDQISAIDGVVASHENNVASQQNRDTRKISAFAALLSIPAVLAGLYGMNFKNLPGVTWGFGWETVIAAAIVLDTWAFIAFKRRRWL